MNWWTLSNGDSWITGLLKEMRTQAPPIDAQCFGEFSEIEWIGIHVDSFLLFMQTIEIAHNDFWKLYPSLSDEDRALIDDLLDTHPKGEVLRTKTCVDRSDDFQSSWNRAGVHVSGINAGFTIPR